jgi:hypothetical protein
VPIFSHVVEREFPQPPPPDPVHAALEAQLHISALANNMRVRLRLRFAPHRGLPPAALPLLPPPRVLPGLPRRTPPPRGIPLSARRTLRTFAPASRTRFRRPRPAS